MCPVWGIALQEGHVLVAHLKKATKTASKDIRAYLLNKKINELRLFSLRERTLKPGQF